MKAGEGLPHMREHSAELRELMKARQAKTGGITRAEMKKQGHVVLVRYGDLLPWGYQIVVWFSPRLHKAGKPAMVYEYAPAHEAKRRYNKGVTLARMTARNAAEQTKIHKKLGAPLQSELQF